MNLNTGTVKLTDLASCGGCAAKYSAARLEQLLAGFVPAEAENLLVGLAPADDAAVYRLDDERALIFTLDFFPPVVDDPGDYGAIAATNALNDVFAMGGTPLLALSIAAFPEELPMEMLAEIFAAADAAGARGRAALLAGGHTIRDAEPKYGLAVVGTVHPDGIWPKNGARPGDALFLTKPLGTGLIMTGHKRGRRRLAAARAGDPLDADAEQRRGRRAARRSSRTRSPTSRASASSATPTRSPTAAACAFGSSRSASRDRRRARRRAPRRADERRPAQSRLRRPARRARRGAGQRSSRSATTRRPRAACSSRSRPSAAPRSRRSSRPASCSSAGSAAWRRAPESSSSERPRDDPRAVPAFPQRPPRVPARRGRALRGALRRDHEPRPAANQARGLRPAAAPARVEPVHLRRAAADGQGRGRRRRDRPGACT